MTDIQPQEEKYLTKDEAYDILYTALGNIRSKAYNADVFMSATEIFKIANEALKKVKA